jgi:hypothetical protein
MTTARVWHSATLLGNGKVLIAGGWDGFKEVAIAELYDPATRTFSRTGSMITPRENHSALLMADGRVLIIGGVSGFNTVNGAGSSISILTAEIYDPSTGAFTAAGALNSSNGGLVFLPDGRVFVTGDNSAEIYDPRSGTSTPTGPFADPSLMYPFPVALLANGKVLVELYDSSSPVGVVTELFDPQSGTFSKTGPFADSGLNIDTVTSLANGKVLVTLCDSVCSVNMAELFDPQSGTFSKTGPMTYPYVPDYGYSAMPLEDGRAFFLGSDDFGTDVEVYDPATGTFASIGNAIQNQIDPGLIRLTDGTVLAAGGKLPGGSGSASAELFVPSSGTFEYAGQMTVGRQSQTEIALPDDTVLITGGFTFWDYPNVQPASSAEIYKPR